MWVGGPPKPVQPSLVHRRAIVHNETCPLPGVFDDSSDPLTNRNAIRRGFP